MRRSDSEWWSNGFTQEWFLGLSQEDRNTFLQSLTDDQIEDFGRDWRVWARDTQLAPEGLWSTWLILAGRGFGKTRTGAETVQDFVRRGEWGRICLIGQGEDDIREVMIEGDSGLLSIAPNDFRPVFQPSVGAGRLQWPNGAVAFCYSAADPESLRGPQFGGAWWDEPMAVPPEQRERTKYNLRMGLRLPPHPRLILTTTPKPHRWIREEVAKGERFAHLPVEKQKYVVTRGSTLDNAANLAENALEEILDEYDGTNLGRQEIYAEILGDEEGALWTADGLDKCRQVEDIPDDPIEAFEYLVAFARTCDRVVVGVDPNTTTSTAKNAHAAGVVVAAKRGKERYVLADRSTKGGPVAWARAAVQAFIDFEADAIVVEVNNGGDMCKMVIETEAQEMDVDVKVEKVRASRGKQRRAEPVAAAYERGYVHHKGKVGTKQNKGEFFLLEEQMTALHDLHDPTGEDFDRADALVWGLTKLGVKKDSFTSRSSTAGFGGIFNLKDFQHGAADHEAIGV